LGDSITTGIFTNGYPTILQDLLNQQQPNRFVVEEHGIAGASVKDWLSTHLSSPEYREIIARGCDAIVLMLGTNDARIGAAFNEEQFCDTMKQLVNRLKNDIPAASVFLATPTPLSPGSDASKCYDVQLVHTVFPRIFPQIAASLGVTCIDCCSPLGGFDASPRLFDDQVHLSHEGDSALASIICEHVLWIFDKEGSPSNPQSPTPPNSMPGGLVPESDENELQAREDEIRRLQELQENQETIVAHMNQDKERLEKENQLQSSRVASLERMVQQRVPLADHQKLLAEQRTLQQGRESLEKENQLLSSRVAELEQMLQERVPLEDYQIALEELRALQQWRDTLEGGLATSLGLEQASDPYCSDMWQESSEACNTEVEAAGKNLTRKRTMSNGIAMDQPLNEEQRVELLEGMIKDVRKKLKEKIIELDRLHHETNKRVLAYETIQAYQGDCLSAVFILYARLRARAVASGFRPPC
jgi:lysophospholipase L1-like esterase